VYPVGRLELLDIGNPSEWLANRSLANDLWRASERENGDERTGQYTHLASPSGPAMTESLVQKLAH